MEQIMLTEAIPGKRYRVVDMQDEARLVSRLSSMGLLRGSLVEVCQNHRKQPVLLFARDTLVAIGRGESKKIIVGDAEDEK